MAVQLQSTNISLLVDYGPEPSREDVVSNPNELWQTLRRTAVEPAQASSQFPVSFADECLFCAHIAINKPAPTAVEGERPLDSPGGRQQIDRRAGIIYLHAGPANLASEANIGVIVRQDIRHRGYAREAVQLVLDCAFDELGFRRVQAAILDTPFRDAALRLFIGTGFTHEGTKRRAVYQPEGEGIAGAWKDVTYLAMLDTEWMVRKRAIQVQERPALTVWDEMFARHAREREELIKWEEKHERVKRPSSSETLKESIRNAAPDLAYLTDDTSSIDEPSRSPSPRPNVVVTWDVAEIDAVSDLDEMHHHWRAATRGHTQWMDSASLQPLDRVLSLPSIPSTRLSEGNPQSPLTIPSSPGSTPPSSPFPSPPTTSWMDSEDEDDWLPNPVLPPPMLSIQLATPRGPSPLPGPASIRRRSRGNSASSSSSTNSWSDAQTSFGTSSGAWDVIDHPQP